MSTCFSPLLTLDSMFIPMASPVVALNLMKTCLPATVVSTDTSLPNLLVELKASATVLKFKESSIHRFSRLASAAEGNLTTGPLVIPSPSTKLLTPPPSDRARQPRFVLATSVASVVAMGTWKHAPSSSSGPATPTGMGVYPITFSQHIPVTRE